MNQLHYLSPTLLLAGALLFADPVPTVAGEKAELKWKKFEAGFAEAKKSNKKIMLDVYTDWCGWCKKLDKDVYGNENVAAYLSEQYVIIKLNAESSARLTFDKTEYSETELAQAFGVSGYPTIIFFDSEGEPLDKIGGYLPATEFLPVLKYFGGDHYKTTSWKEFRDAYSSQPGGQEKKKK